MSETGNGRKNWTRVVAAVGLVFLAVAGGIVLANANKVINKTEKKDEETPLISIGFSQVGAESEWRTGNSISIKTTFSQKRGYDLIFKDAQQQQEQQIKAIRGFIQQDVNYIVLAPVKELSKDLEEIMKNYSTIAYFGGIGQPVARLRELEESFREAERALAARFTMELNRIISVEDIRMAQNVDTLDDIEITSFGEIEKTRTMLEKFLNNGAEDEIDEFVDVYINELPEENLKSVLMRQYIIMDAYIVMMSFCEKIEGIEGEMQAQSEELKNSMKTIQTLEEIKNYIRMLLKKIIGVRDTISGRRYSDIIEIAKDQIRKTYMSDEISLNTIAAEVGMSPSYFSSIFSKEMGKTFVEYLTEIRMDRAKELLMCSSMKTSEIGYEVGYKDPHYFSYIFKKTQNCTPKEFRARGKE